MRPPRTPSASSDATDPGQPLAPACDGDRVPSASGVRSAPEEPDGAGQGSTTGGLTVRDHARLAERLADDIGRLRQARLSHHDVGPARDRLEAFLSDDLIPSLHVEDGARPESSDRSRRAGWRGSRGQRRIHRRVRDRRRIIDAAHALRLADTPVLALVRAEHLRALFFAHLAWEDRELLAAARAGADDRSGPSAGAAALSAELDKLLVHDHGRISAAVTVARDAAAGGSDDELYACDRAVAALSQHAAVMSTRAYPMVRRVLPGPDRAATRALTEDLRGAVRALWHLNRLLRGTWWEEPEGQERLWKEVERAWQRHVADEEPLIRRVAPSLRPERVASLITSLRRPVGHSLTRAHPRLLRGGWPTGLAIRAHYRFDRFRDVLDNRASWRAGA